jgi:hypothetical protein
MTNKQWEKFWQAYINRRPYRLKSVGSDLSLSVKWVDKIEEVVLEPITDFYNPFDQKVYAARWDLATPDVGIAEGNGSARMEFLRLLTDTNTMREDIAPEILGVYARQLSDKILEIAYGIKGEAGRFIFQVTLQHHEPPVIDMIAEKTLTDMTYFEEARKAAMTVESLQIKKEDIVFHLNFVIGIA